MFINPLASIVRQRVAFADPFVAVHGGRSEVSRGNIPVSARSPSSISRRVRCALPTPSSITPSHVTKQRLSWVSTFPRTHSQPKLLPEPYHCAAVPRDVFPILRDCYYPAGREGDTKIPQREEN
ncbi:hypothetical protein Bbelb_015270 [Branchiostoma belcheri]|nr:hypothetical protein Bbelb_015270 [Branchiostoma belcheri]